jgi:Protein of unknown function (DUF2630)
MADDALHDRIHALVEEEHELRQRHSGQGLDDRERARLKQVEVQLDQTWDLLRRRNARREAGQDPGAEGSERDPATVEGYLQ